MSEARITHEVMNVAEFQCRHQEDRHDEPSVPADLVLTDVNGIPLPLEATVVVEYHDELPVAYCVCDEEWTDPNSFIRNEGGYRPLS